MLPPKRQRPRSGILRAPKREWPRHRRFVRSHACSVPGCGALPIEFAHIRCADNSGVALKPHDAFGISLCSHHHLYQHQVGQAAFEREFKINLQALAAEFTKASPDAEMRSSLVEPLR